MEYRIREYMDQLFESAPHTQRAYELKIELTQNLIEKYYALVGEGKDPEDAYNLTIMSIGDVRELFSQLEDDEDGNPVPPPVYYPQPQPDHRRALVRTAAVMLGCTETTFYTVAVYFGAAGIKKTRYAIPAALCADIAAFLAAAWAVKWWFG